jgi:protein-S-isoprenylcysteine O-methyltransferase Ste14
MPDSRRRIRTANGMLMLFTAPLLAYALGFANPAADQRAFVLSWMLVTGLLIIILLVAMLDIANNYRLMFLQRKALREELRRERMEALEQAR